MRQIDRFKNNLITEVRTCQYCGVQFAIEKYLDYKSCSDCRNKEEYNSLRLQLMCVDCGGKFEASSPTDKRCRSCGVAFRKNISKTKCTYCKKEFYDVQETGLCGLCRREAVRKKRSATCRMCGGPKPPRVRLCSSCLASAKLNACTKPCVICGKLFTPKALTCKTTKYCSEECAEIANKNRNEARRAKLGSAEEIRQKLKQTLIQNPTYTTAELLSEVGISYGTAAKRGIKISDIRAELGIHTPKTKISKSKFEERVKSIILEAYPDLRLECQKTFSDLKDKNYLRYDFFIPALNLLIEADGHQHTYKYDVPGFDDPVPHDLMKNAYASANNIHLIRIHYFATAKKCNEFKQLLINLRCRIQETKCENLFNCWNGGDKLLPISSQAYYKDRRSKKVQRPGREVVGTKPTGSEMGDTLT